MHLSDGARYGTGILQFNISGALGRLDRFHLLVDSFAFLGEVEMAAKKKAKKKVVKKKKVAKKKVVKKKKVAKKKNVTKKKKVTKRKKR